MEFQAENLNHLISSQRQIKQKPLVELHHTGNAFKSVKFSVSLQLPQGYQTLDPARTLLPVSFALAKHSSSLLMLFYSSPLIQEFMALTAYLWKSIIAMATVSCSKFWISSSIVQLLAFPSLRGATCFTWHRRCREGTELLSLVEDFLSSIELIKFLKLCRAERLALSILYLSSCIPTQWLWSWVKLHTSSSLLKK